MTDITPEPDETIFIMMLNPTNGASLIEDTLVITINDNDQVGIENNFSLSGVKIFPAVSNGIFYVNTDLNSLVIVTDIFGNEVWNKKNVAGKLRLDLQNLPKQIYFIAVENAEGQIVRKVIIQ